MSGEERRVVDVAVPYKDYVNYSGSLRHLFDKYAPEIHDDSVSPRVVFSGRSDYGESEYGLDPELHAALVVGALAVRRTLDPANTNKEPELLRTRSHHVGLTLHSHGLSYLLHPLVSEARIGSPVGLALASKIVDPASGLLSTAFTEAQLRSPGFLGAGVDRVASRQSGGVEQRLHPTEDALDYIDRTQVLAEARQAVSNYLQREHGIRISASDRRLPAYGYGALVLRTQAAHHYEKNQNDQIARAYLLDLVDACYGLDNVRDLRQANETFDSFLARIIPDRAIYAAFMGARGLVGTPDVRARQVELDPDLRPQNIVRRQVERRQELPQDRQNVGEEVQEGGAFAYTEGAQASRVEVGGDDETLPPHIRNRDLVRRILRELAECRDRNLVALGLMAEEEAQRRAREAAAERVRQAAENVVMEYFKQHPQLGPDNMRFLRLSDSTYLNLLKGEASQIEGEAGAGRHAMDWAAYDLQRHGSEQTPPPRKRNEAANYLLENAEVLGVELPPEIIRKAEEAQRTDLVQGLDRPPVWLYALAAKTVISLGGDSVMPVLSVKGFGNVQGRGRIVEALGYDIRRAYGRDLPDSLLSRRVRNGLIACRYLELHELTRLTPAVRDMLVRSVGKEFSRLKTEEVPEHLRSMHSFVSKRYHELEGK